MKPRLIHAAVALVVGCATGVHETTEKVVDDLPSAKADEEPEGLARSGGVVVRRGDVLLIADEDRSMLRVVPLAAISVGGEPLQLEVPLPGRPAAVTLAADRVLVTVRDPGLVVSLRVRDDGGWEETGRVVVPDDAWGIAVLPDQRTAVVTSAWARAVTGIDLDTMTVRWTLGVPREPRAVVVMPGGRRAYVTHLTGSALTRIDDIGGARPTLTRVSLPAAPMRTPDDAFEAERLQAATLAYSATLSPGGERLFVPRHALGATGKLAWAGQPTVDILLTGDDTPLAGSRPDKQLLSRVDIPLTKRDDEVNGPGVLQRRPVFAQPRAVVYRQSTDTLLVASEGRDTLVELDARSIDPAAHELRRYELDPWSDSADDDRRPGDSQCGAPSGVALSSDETIAYVFCRTTGTLAVVELEADAMTRWPLAEDPLSERAALGRRLFYDAVDNTMSFGLACAGCHPEGRDDGHVWHELASGVLRAFPENQAWFDLPMRGEARQTLMLAGRIEEEGPFGWRGESDTLERRILRGFETHHWYNQGWIDRGSRERAAALAEFLLEGLVPPPERKTARTEAEQAGQAIFESATTGCASCHVPQLAYSDRKESDLDLRADSARFLGAERARFRTPPLGWVGGSEPYLHDGSASTLEQLLASNHDRMGLTSHLSAHDSAALVAFMRSLGGPSVPPEPIAIGPATPPQIAQPPLGPRPTDAELFAAPLFTVSRSDARCEARRLDTNGTPWVRLSCKLHVSEIELVGGAADGVVLGHSQPYVRPPRAWWDYATEVDDAVLTFPLRRGDRRLFQLVFGWGRRWGGADFDVALVVSEVWLEGDAEPTITIH